MKVIKVIFIITATASVLLEIMSAASDVSYKHEDLGTRL